MESRFLFYPRKKGEKENKDLHLVLGGEAIIKRGERKLIAFITDYSGAPRNFLSYPSIHSAEKRGKKEKRKEKIIKNGGGGRRKGGEGGRGAHCLSSAKSRKREKPTMQFFPAYGKRKGKKGETKRG